VFLSFTFILVHIFQLRLSLEKCIWFGFRFGESAVYRVMVRKLPTFGAVFPGERLAGAFIRWMGVGVRIRGGRVVLLFLLLGWVCAL